MNIILNPETEALKRNIEVLKTELNNIVSDYELLVNFVCINIQNKYMTLVGYSKLEVLYLECDTRKLKRKIELIQSCINRNENIDFNKIENQLDHEMKEWHIQINKYLSELKQVEKNVALMNAAPDNSELKKLFRKLSKILHPDINPDLPEKYRLLWHRVHEAYKNCDVEELKTIELMIEMDKVVVQEASSLDELSLRKKKLDESISHYIRKIELVKSSHPYKLIEIIDNKELIAEELSALDKQKQNLLELIDKYKSVLNKIDLSGYVGLSLN